jgi:hypothetical protein
LIWTFSVNSIWIASFSVSLWARLCFSVNIHYINSFLCFSADWYFAVILAKFFWVVFNLSSSYLKSLSSLLIS